MKRVLTQQEIREKRREENEDLLRRVENGDNVKGMARDSWYPPRPVIEKSKEDIEKLYGNNGPTDGDKKEDGNDFT